MHPIQQTTFGSVFHTYFYPPSGAQNETAGQAVMTKSMAKHEKRTNGKTRGIQKTNTAKSL
jgi:hypothetical protein